MTDELAVEGDKFLNLKFPSGNTKHENYSKDSIPPKAGLESSDPILAFKLNEKSPIK